MVYVYVYVTQPRQVYHSKNLRLLSMGFLAVCQRNINIHTRDQQLLRMFFAILEV